MKVHIQDGEIAVTSPATRYLLSPDEAREAKAAALWAEWLDVGAIAETGGGLRGRGAGASGGAL